MRQARPVPRSVADERQRLLGEARQDQFSHLAFRQALAGLWVNDFGNEVILEDVQPLLFSTFDRDAGADHLRKAVDIERDDAKTRFDLLTHPFRPRLRAENPYP